MLNVNELSGFGINKIPAEATLTASSIAAAGLSGYTFSAQNIGAASSDRIVVVALTGERNDALGTVSAVTIGGVSATVLGNYNGTLNAFCAIAYLAVPDGTSKDIVVNLSVASNYCAIWVYSVTGATGFVSSSEADDTDTVSLSAQSDAVIGVASDSTAGTLTLSGSLVSDGQRADGSYKGIAGNLSNASGTTTMTVSEVVRTLLIASFR